MKLSYYAFMLMMCINIATWIHQQLGINLSGLTATSPSQIVEQFNATATVRSWGGFTNIVAIVGDIVAVMQMLWNTMWTFIVGFPMFIAGLGAPLIIVISLDALWSMIWVFFVYEMISGRTISEG